MSTDDNVPGRDPAATQPSGGDATTQPSYGANEPTRGAATARSRARAARRSAGTSADDPTLSASSNDPTLGTARSDRLVSEAVMAGLDAMSGSSRKVPVGAGGGGLPSRPEDETRSLPEGPIRPYQGDGIPDRVLEPPEEGDYDDAADIRALSQEDKDHPLVRVGGVLDSFVRECGELTILGGQVLKSAVIHPRGYWHDVKDQFFDALKLCWVPMVFAVGGFGFGAPGLQGGNILYLFGVPDRLGGFMMFATIREFGPFVEAMVVAGVVGTAITADLGARRIREEIDAMEVLGVDPIRKLIVPRVVSVTIMTAMFDLFALFLGLAGGFAAGSFLTSSSSGFVASFYSESNISDDWGSVAKTAIFGVIIGLVCCYKGFRAKGGPAGVGRAVNQAVVISFALIWVVDYTFTNLLLGYAPSTQVIK